MRKLLIALGVLVVIVAVIQLVPYGRDTTNPPVLAEPGWDSPRTRELFLAACADCHSNETVWPAYSKVAPVSWLVARDVEEGRDKFNVSEWGRPGENEGDEASELVTDREMPPRQYLLMHSSAKLSDAEREELVRGLTATFGEADEGEAADEAGSESGEGEKEGAEDEG